MRTIKEVSGEIKNLRKYALKSKSDGDEKESKKAIREVNFLKNVLWYLETSPREEFLKSELIKLTKRVDNINEHYANWLKNDKPPSVLPEKAKSFYAKEMGVPLLKSQIKTITYILG